MPSRKHKHKMVILDIRFLVKIKVKEGINLDDLEDIVGEMMVMTPKNADIVSATLDSWNLLKDLSRCNFGS